MARLAHDDVVTIRGHAQKRPRIVDDQIRARIVERTVVDVIEELRSGNSARLKLDTRHRLNRRLQHRADRDAGRISDNQPLSIFGAISNGNCPKHHLRRHVVDAVRRICAPVDRHRDGVLVATHRNRGSWPFLIHQQLMNV